MTKFDNSPGVYYENVVKTVFYSTDWKVVVYLPLRTIRNQLATLGSYVKYVEQVCARIDLNSWTVCNYLDDLTSTRLGQARETEQLIAKIVGKDDDKHRRKKGLFDFVGKVSEVLFGTLGGDDVQYYNEQIEHFERNSNSLTHLLRQQLTIVRSTFVAVNDTLSDVSFNERKMKNGLLQLQHYVNAMGEHYGNVTNLLYGTAIGLSTIFKKFL